MDFGNQWVVSANCNPGADDQSDCVEGSLKQVKAKDKCYPLVDPNGKLQQHANHCKILSFCN